MAQNNTPKHVAIIPDGNRRWAKENNFPPFEGHRKGFDTIKLIGKKARELGIKTLSIWAFSTENWQRSKQEIEYLMDIYEMWIDFHLTEAIKDNVRIIHIGRKDRLRDSLRKKLENAENKTKSFNKYYLCIGIDYGGKDEIIRGINLLINSKKSKISEADFEKVLDTKDLPYPNPDLIIRTSGEQRTSGFMIWQSAYSEYIFYNKYLPDFTPLDFEKCIEDYKNRSRRFGE
jgi:undecaprenyl diphosphate synthase